MTNYNKEIFNQSSSFIALDINTETRCIQKKGRDKERISRHAFF